MNKLIIILIFIIPSISNAGSAWIKEAKVTQTLIMDENYGDCMIHLDINISEVGLDCPGKWVSLSCSGDFNTKATASRMYDLALMTGAMGKKVTLRVTDSKKHNGYCVANRLDVVF